MKKTLVAVLLLAGLVGAQSAFATSPVTVDIDSAFTLLNGFGLGYNATSDKDSNGMYDLTEYSLLTSILANAGLSQHNAVHAAWNTNFAALDAARAQVAAVFGANAGIAVQTVMAAALTCGDAGKVTYVLASLTGLGIGGTMPASPDLSASTILGKNADPDSDSLDNFAEYTAAGGDRVQYASNAITAAGPANLEVTISGGGSVVSGSDVTLTANVTGGVEPYTYQWTKGGSPVGTNATLPLGAVDMADADTYAVHVTDSQSAPDTADASVALTVVASLPVAGVAGLALLMAACAGLGARKALKK